MRLDWILVKIGLNFHFLVSKWHLLTLNLLFLESDDFLQGPFTAKCNGQKMKWDWILLRICPNFLFPASKWHLSDSKYPEFAVPWQWRFPAKSFFSKQSHAVYHTLPLNTIEFSSDVAYCQNNWMLQHHSFLLNRRHRPADLFNLQPIQTDSNGSCNKAL